MSITWAVVCIAISHSRWTFRIFAFCRFPKDFLLCIWLEALNDTLLNARTATFTALLIGKLKMKERKKSKIKTWIEFKIKRFLVIWCGCTRVENSSWFNCTPGTSRIGNFLIKLPPTTPMSAILACNLSYPHTCNLQMLLVLLSNRIRSLQRIHRL